VNGVRVGIIGVTTERGPRAVGTEATQAFDFTRGEDEVGPIVRALRDSGRVDVVVVASELELAKNVMLGERVGGIDVILSADMHERTTRPIVTRRGTVIVEEGQDGTVLGELTLRVARGRVQSWTFRQHVVDGHVAEDPEIARLVALARAPFIRGAAFDPGQRNPINGARLGRPIDEVVGTTTVALHRASPTGSAMPASIEGTSHDLLADAFRHATGADIGAVRGFRFGTQVAPGPITVADLYHFLPIGAQIGRAHPVGGAELRLQIESSLRGVFDPDPRLWTGGWLFGFSGITFDVDVRRPFGSRASNVRVNGAPLDTSGTTAYAIAGLWFGSEPGSVNNCGACMRPGATVEVLRDENGEPLDAVEVVARYLRHHGPVGPHEPRVRLHHPLPRGPYGFDVLQPLPLASPAVAQGTGSNRGER
jgi:2',3'-cyclic-nucleotide 2'-phosphodiesterase (5'-nucleotidase family)